MPYKDKEAQAANAKRHYEANKEAYKARAAEWTRRQRDILREHIRQIKDVPCMDCGGSFPTQVMEFDHVRGQKMRDIATLVGGGVSVATLQAEIDKCEVVCANCHRMRTVDRRELVNDGLFE